MQCPHELKIEILTWVGLEPGTLDYETIVLPFCHRGHFKEFKPRVSYTLRKYLRRKMRGITMKATGWSANCVKLAADKVALSG